MKKLQKSGIHIVIEKEPFYNRNKLGRQKNGRLNTEG